MKQLDSISNIEDLVSEYGEYLPKHVGLILDGNRRWIKRQGLKDTLKGHLAGYETLRKIITPMFRANVEYLSIYALSSENIAKRSSQELKYLYKLLMKGVLEVLQEKQIFDNEVKVSIIGRIHELPDIIQEEIKKVHKITAKHNKRFINVCINYDGQLEIVDALKSIMESKIPIDQIDKNLLKKHLYTKKSPELDYMIRTGMEDGARISGFLLWDASYAEFRFRDELWPEYNEEMLIDDFKHYIRRNRRKGA